MFVFIIDLFKFNVYFFFFNEDRDWGCEGYKESFKKDLDIGENYYEV